MATEKLLIDATPLIDECEECSAIEWNKSVYTTWAEAEEDFMQRLLDAPTVDAVEVVHGHWCWQGKFRACSKCGSYVEFTETLGASFWKFCPFCGAKMDGDGNG